MAKNNIPTHFANASNEKAWHGTGNTLSAEALRDYNQALKEANLDGELVKKPVKNAFTGEESDEFFHLYYLENNGKAHMLHPVKENYAVIAPSRMFRFVADLLTAQQDWTIASLGALDNGKQMFANIRTVETEIVEGDPVKMFVQFIVNNNGRKNEVFTSLIQMVCDNTVRYAVTEAKKNGSQLAFGHYGNHEQAMSFALKAAEAATSAQISLLDKLRFLAGRELSSAGKEAFFNAFYAMESKEGKALVRTQNEIAAIEAQDGVNVLSYRGKAIEYFNKYTRALSPTTATPDFTFGVHGKTDEEKRNAMALSASFGELADRKAQVLDLLFEIVK